jgi:hypothetical protein
MDTMTFKSLINKITKIKKFLKLEYYKKFMKKRSEQKNGGQVYFSIHNYARNKALFAPFWNIICLLFLVVLYIIGICLF